MILDLIEEIEAQTRLSAAQAQMALAGSLAILRKHGDRTKVGALMAAIAGADALVAQGNQIISGSGFVSGLMKFAGGATGAAAADAMAMGAYLKKYDIKSADLKPILPISRKFILEETGSDLLGDALMSIPGVAQFMTPKT